MLVGKTELSNIKSLLKIRNRECTGIRYIYYLLLVLFALDLISVIREVFSFNRDAVGISIQPYSNWSFVFTIFACLFYTINYKDYNYKHQIYPQNSNSSFISYLLFCYITFAKLQAAALGLYLLQYGICRMLDVIKRNIDFAYPINLYFLSSGILVTFLYGFMIQTLIILAGALDRKFTWLLRITIAVSLVILWTMLRTGLLTDIAGFVTKEYSLPLFLLKAFFLWLLLMVISFGINIQTRQYKQKREFKIYHAFATADAFAITMALLIVFIGFRFSTGNSLGSTYDTTNELLEGAKYQADVSSIQDGSQLRVVLTDNENLIIPAGTQTKYEDRILINFQPPTRMENNVVFSDYTKPELNMSLEDNVLTIRITALENRKVILLYPFSFLQEFASYKDKRYYKKNPGYSSSSMGSNGFVYLFLPENKNLTIIK